jgi:cell division protein FtsL
MTAEMLGWSVLAGMLLVCLGVLLGATWTTQALQPKLRQQAEERRKLNNQWAVLRAARKELSRCPRCGYLITGRG